VNVFERLESEFTADDVTKNGVWDRLVAREDMILGDDKELPLSKSPLKKLALEDLALLGLSERKIFVKGREKAAAAVEMPVVVATGVDINQRINPTAKRKASEYLPSAPAAKRPEILTSTPKKVSDRPTRVIKRTPKKASPISTLAEASPDERLIHEAIFTSQDDLDCEAGISGVYINPTGSAKPVDPQQRGRRKKSCILVFKSAKLRDPEWFEKNRAATLIRLASVEAQRIIEAEDTPALKRKPRNRKRESTDEADETSARKKRKTSKAPKQPISLECDSNPENSLDTPEGLQATVTSAVFTQVAVANAPDSTENATRARNLDANSEKQNGGSPVQVTPVTSETAASAPSSTPIPPVDPSPMSTPASSFPSRHAVPPPLSMLAQMLAHTPSTYASPFGSYTSPYSSPYAARPTPQAPQKPSTLAQTVPSTDISQFVSQAHQQLPTLPQQVRSAHISQPIPQPYQSATLPQLVPSTETSGSVSQVYQHPSALPQSGLLAEIPQSLSQPYQQPVMLAQSFPLRDASQPLSQLYPKSESLAQPVFSMGSPLGAQTLVQGPPRGFFSRPPPNSLIWSDLFTPKSPPNRLTSASPTLRHANDETRKRRLSQASSQPAETQVKPPAKKGRPKPEPDQELVMKLAQAESITPPEGSARLACVFQELCGNLLVSKDMSALEFIWAIQPPPESPTLVLPISRVTQNPITSMPGSKPMELRIKAKNDNGEDVTHCFIFAETDRGTAAANDMRARIVTALIAFRFNNGGSWQNSEDIKREKEKPFKCGKCEKRFKNIGGLDYHLKKSKNSTCNPNCDLKLIAKKQARAEKRIAPKPPKEPKEPKQPKMSSTQTKKPKQAEPILPERQKTPLELQDPEQSDSTTSSEDSVIEFWKQNSTSGVERPRKVVFGATPTISPSKSKVYKSLPFETAVLREIAEEMAVTGKLNGVDNTLEASSTGLMEPTTTLKQLDTQQCQEILLPLIHDNDNIFPGDRSIWIAFVAACLGKPKGSLILPESKLCSKTVDQLVESKKLKSTNFTFVDAKKRAITRSILTVHGSDVSSKQINTMKETIKLSHPAFYVPPKFAPPEPALSKLIALATRKLVNRDRYRMQESADLVSEPSDSHSQSPIDLDDESSDDDFVGDWNEDDVADLSIDEEEGTEIENEIDETRQKSPKEHMLGRKRTARHNKNIAKGVRRAWLAKKARQGSDNSSGFFPRRKPRKDVIPLTQEQKEKRAAHAALRQQSWNAALAFMPNPETGAWNQEPQKPKPSRTSGHRELRPHVYPITFMQALNGAWSVRPFGHGVKPIYARPSKRVYGNPTGEAYELRRDNGHQPVIYPTKNRKLGPPVPSKNLWGRRSPPTFASRKNSKPGDKISKRKGKPVRQYVKRARSSRSPESPDSEEVRILVASETKPSDRSWLFQRWVPNDKIIPAKKSSRGANVLDEVDILNFFEPRKLEPGAPRNPGLETIPPTFGLDASKYEGSDPEDYAFLPGYVSLEFIEPNIVEEGLSPFQGSWTVRDWAPSVSEDYNVRWDDATALDLETIPYEHIKVDSGNPEGEPIDDLPVRKRQKRQFVPHPPGPKELPAAEKYSFVRIFTALPNDFDGIGENPEAAAKEFGVELARPNEATENNRRMKGPRAVMVPEVERRFIITVVVIRTLTGGIEARVDWVLVSQYFQDYSCNFLKKYWLLMQKMKKNSIEKLVSDFQEAFLLAYESGEIPPLDYDHLVGYDWQNLIDWAAKNVDTSLKSKSIDMPESKQELKQMYDFTELEPDPNRWRESFFGQVMPICRRVEVAAAEPNTIRPRRESTSDHVDELTLARSWVRAAVLTPQQDYDVSIATAKMNQLGNPLVKKVVEGFQGRKGIIKKAKKQKEAGRQYESSDFFWVPFRRLIKDKVFAQAASFKRFLDEQFSSGIKCVRHNYFANEGAIMATTTLQAQGRVRLELIDVPINKWGLTDGGYETRTIDREKLIFNMDIYPTNSYIYDSDNESLKAFFAHEPPRGPERGEIPVWRGICDLSIPEIWKKVLVAVGQTVALRSGITIAQLKKTFKPSMEEWEIRILMEWGTEIGFFKQLHESIEGWTVGEDWWLIVARICDDGQ